MIYWTSGCFEEPELDAVIRISGDGNAIFPLIGAVSIAGKTIGEATELLRKSGRPTGAGHGRRGARRGAPGRHRLPARVALPVDRPDLRRAAPRRPQLPQRWGHVFHTDNLLVLHVGIVGLAPAADAWAVGARAVEPADDVRYGWPLRLAAVVTVLTYVVTGVAKLRYAGARLARPATRCCDQIAFDNARKKVLGDDLLAAGRDVRRPPLAVPADGRCSRWWSSWGRRVALLGRRWAAAWAAAAWTFHVGIVALMWISFAVPAEPHRLRPVLPHASAWWSAWPSRTPVRRLADMTPSTTPAVWSRRPRAVTVLTGAGHLHRQRHPRLPGPERGVDEEPGGREGGHIQNYVSDPEVRKRAWRNRLDSEAWTAQPNAGHLALVELERQGKLAHARSPRTSTASTRPPGSDPARVVEVHGTIREVGCLNCGERAPMERALERVRAGEEDPECRTCGGMLKSATISFGQSLVADDLGRAERAARECDLLLAVGSTCPSTRSATSCRWRSTSAPPWSSSTPSPPSSTTSPTPSSAARSARSSREYRSGAERRSGP